MKLSTGEAPDALITLCLIYFKELRLKAAYNDGGQKSKQCMTVSYTHLTLPTIYSV